MDVVILESTIILNPDFSDQPKMINKLSYRWVGVALASRFVNKGLVQRKFRLRFRNFHFFEPLS